MLKFRGKKIYLACGSTDMRKGINGLAAIVEQSFKLDSFGGAAFVFCRRKGEKTRLDKKNVSVYKTIESNREGGTGT